jgi:hypothetical protein
MYLQNSEGRLLPFVVVSVLQIENLLIMINNEFPAVAGLKHATCENSSAKFQRLCLVSLSLVYILMLKIFLDVFPTFLKVY